MSVFYVFLQINMIEDATEGPMAGSPAFGASYLNNINNNILTFVLKTQKNIL